MKFTNSKIRRPISDNNFEISLSVIIILVKQDTVELVYYSLSFMRNNCLMHDLNVRCKNNSNNILFK